MIEAPRNIQSGLIQWIVLIIIVILVLSYFGFDLRGLISDEGTEDNFSVVWEYLTLIWERWLETPAKWIWENIISFIWNDLFLENLEKLQGGEGFRDLGPDTPSVE